MISEDDVFKALDYLRNTAQQAAQARANRAYIDEYRKVIKAQIMAEHPDDPLGVQERKAYSDKRYIEHLKAIRESVQADEYLRFMREAADAKIRAWQTQQANLRAESKVFP